MGMNDTVADMLTRIRNANKERIKTTDVICSKLNKELARILQQEGFIEKVELVKDKKGFDFIRIYLKYRDAKTRVITGVQRISRPGCRVYVGSAAIPKVLNGYGVAVLSTHKGLQTDKSARSLNVGGEHICNIW
ncbi:MAG: 30S ribosomal protein S8 [Deltaproteobacteria bacterium]|nr:30S ribosomal protein S8 [Deltaproteobacteria bacterium]